MSMCLYVYVPYICIHMNAGMAKSCWGTRADARASAPWGRSVRSAALEVELYFHTFVWSLQAPGFHSRLSCLDGGFQTSINIPTQHSQLRGPSLLL